MTKRKRAISGPKKPEKQENELENFDIGDYVFAKMKGYPPWPGRVQTDPPRMKPPKSRPHCVFFYGTHDTQYFSPKDLLPYEENLSEWGPPLPLSDKRIGAKFNLAMWEVHRNPTVETDAPIPRYGVDVTHQEAISAAKEAARIGYQFWDLPIPPELEEDSVPSSTTTSSTFQSSTSSKSVVRKTPSAGMSNSGGGSNSGAGAGIVKGARLKSATPAVSFSRKKPAKMEVRAKSTTKQPASARKDPPKQQHSTTKPDPHSSRTTTTANLKKPPAHHPHVSVQHRATAVLVSSSQYKSASSASFAAHKTATPISPPPKKRIHVDSIWSPSPPPQVTTTTACPEPPVLEQSASTAVGSSIFESLKHATPKKEEVRAIGDEHDSTLPAQNAFEFLETAMTSTSDELDYNFSLLSVNQSSAVIIKQEPEEHLFASGKFLLSPNQNSAVAVKPEPEDHHYGASEKFSPKTETLVHDCAMTPGAELAVYADSTVQSREFSEQNGDAMFPPVHETPVNDDKQIDSMTEEPEQTPAPWSQFLSGTDEFAEEVVVESSVPSENLLIPKEEAFDSDFMGKKEAMSPKPSSVGNNAALKPSPQGFAFTGDCYAASPSNLFGTFGAMSVTTTEQTQPSPEHPCGAATSSSASVMLNEEESASVVHPSSVVVSHKPELPTDALARELEEALTMATSTSAPAPAVAGSVLAGQELCRHVKMEMFYYRLAVEVMKNVMDLKKALQRECYEFETAIAVLTEIESKMKIQILRRQVFVCIQQTSFELRSCRKFVCRECLAKALRSNNCGCARVRERSERLVNIFREWFAPKDKKATTTNVDGRAWIRPYNEEAEAYLKSHPHWAKFLKDLATYNEQRVKDGQLSSSGSECSEEEHEEASEEEEQEDSEIAAAGNVTDSNSNQ